MNETTKLRRRDTDRQDEDDRASLPPPSPGSPSIIVKTMTVATYPTDPFRSYAVRRVLVGGTESEGATPSFTPTGGTFYAQNIGVMVPPPGTLAVADFTNGRWVFRYDG